MGFGKLHEGLDLQEELERPPARAIDRPEIAHRWALVLDALRDAVDEFKWHIWLSDLELVGWQPGSAHLFVTAPTHALEAAAIRYGPLLTRTARAVLGNDLITVAIVPTNFTTTSAAPRVPGSTNTPRAEERASGPAERRDPDAQRGTLESPPERTDT